MAESGAVSGVIGADSDSPAEGPIPEGSTPLDPTAAALAADTVRNDPKLAEEVSDYFRKQSRLVEIQTEHLHEQRAVNLSLLKLKRFGETLRLGLQVLILLLAAVLGVLVVALLRDAVTSRTVVVEAFDAPPELGSRGITGKVVATSLLDELKHLQSATKTSGSQRELSDSWSNELDLELPEVGISIGAISRLLRVRFGHDLYISGELVQAPGGTFTLTARATGVAQKTFTGASAALDSLVIDAADYIYSEAQSAQWAYYLDSTGHPDEAIAFVRTAFARVGKADRPTLLAAWGVALEMKGQFREAVTVLRQSIFLDPRYLHPYLDLTNASMAMGEEETAWKGCEQLRRAAGGRPGRAPEIFYSNCDFLTFNLLASRNALAADRDASVGIIIGDDGLSIAEWDVYLHDVSAAELELAALPTDDNGPMTHYVHGLLAIETGDTQRAGNEMTAFHSSLNMPEALNSAAEHCRAAPAEEFAGHSDIADAILKTGTYVDCYRFRGDILDHRGNWAGAQKAYADSVALAPDLPAGYYSWGLALARHGETAAAISQLKEANQRGPHWADPLKAWGDVLAQQGRTKEALEKYEEGLKYAPNWQQLKQARERAAKQKI